MCGATIQNGLMPVNTELSRYGGRMDIGVPREIMDKEYRVSMVPAGVQTMVKAGHSVFVEKGAGMGSGIHDSEFEQAGATILANAEEVFAAAEMIIKVKEPLESEFPRFREEQILYTFLHLAPKKELTDFLCRKNIQAVGYETIQLDDGSLPLLAPMSEVAGRMSVQVGAYYLEKGNGGSGVLLGGVPGQSLPTAAGQHPMIPLEHQL